MRVFICCTGKIQGWVMENRRCRSIGSDPQFLTDRPLTMVQLIPRKT